MPTLDPGRSFGAEADRYDRARPSYPAAMLERVIDASPGPRVLDVGCGTGISARQFAASGCQVLGVEVDPRMADVARRRGLDVEVSAFEDWDPAGRRFDTVVAGQTWHWIDPVAGAAKAREALRPGGLIALFWNVFQPPPEILAAFSGPFAEIWKRPVLHTYSTMFSMATNGIHEAGGFADAEQWRFEWERPYTRAEWLDQLPTHGGYPTLSQAQQADLLSTSGAAIDALGGSFTMPYTTVVVAARRD
ncbi:bifunctional 2-polyprenyl-6-hydroxyphenol methylase/3-demethylubiquinol 3-O-methyltransferase UbiG [Allokutzneria sp. NRRL B-24872]|uniref:class I SAM-dependent methyltransferase n=1 Tax=Allokutzneria sp. NRRL B-24872 TaxID=1137961 RepID=UPI000A372635|nr:class I SAM-dependent methyltransferase [Allokutzneria sp. NRRL B-24872]